jgi:hypothetical protein
MCMIQLSPFHLFKSVDLINVVPFCSSANILYDLGKEQALNQRWVDRDTEKVIGHIFYHSEPQQ